MYANLLTSDHVALLREHCRKYTERFANAVLPGSGRSVRRQTRTLERVQNSDRPSAGQTSDASDSDTLLELDRRESPLRVFVTGIGGSGKSDFARHLAGAAADRALAVLTANPPPLVPLLVPVLYELKDLEEGTDLLEQIALTAFKDSTGHPLLALGSGGRALIILDGLDELPGTATATFHNRLSRLLSKSQLGTACSVVVTGREASLTENVRDCLGIDERGLLRLTPLKAPQVVAFINAYFAGRDASRGEEVVRSLALSPPELVTLLSQPFMLAMACAGLDGGSLRLPADPSDVFRLGLLNLLERRRSGTDLTGGRRMKLDASIALDKLRQLAAFASELGFRFTVDGRMPTGLAVDGLLDSQGVLDDLAPNSGVLTVRRAGAAAEYAFADRILAEYLAGTHIANETGSHDTTNDAYEQAVQPPSLAYYGRHAWSDDKRNVLKWITAEWWRSGEAGRATAVRAGDWLVRHLLPSDGRSCRDDVRGTLLHRLLDLLSTCRDEASQRHLCNTGLIEALHRIVPAEWPFERGPVALGPPEIAALPTEGAAAPYLNAIVRELHGTEQLNIGSLCKTLATTRPSWTGLVQTVSEALIDKIHKLGPASPIVPYLARTLAAVGAARPDIQRIAHDAVASRILLKTSRLLAVCICVDQVREMGSWCSDLLDLAVGVLARRLKGPAVNAGELLSLATALAVADGGTTDWAQLAFDAIHGSLAERNRSGSEAAPLALALGAIASYHPRLEDLAGATLRTVLAMPGLKNGDVVTLANALVVVGRGRPEPVAAAVDAVDRALCHPFDRADLPLHRTRLALAAGQPALQRSAENSVWALLNQDRLSPADTSLVADALASAKVCSPDVFGLAIRVLHSQVLSSDTNAASVSALLDGLLTVSDSDSSHMADFTDVLIQSLCHCSHVDAEKVARLIKAGRSIAIDQSDLYLSKLDHCLSRRGSDKPWVTTGEIFHYAVVAALLDVDRPHLIRAGLRALSMTVNRSTTPIYELRRYAGIFSELGFRRPEFLRVMHGALRRRLEQSAAALDEVVEIAEAVLDVGRDNAALSKAACDALLRALPGGIRSGFGVPGAMRALRLLGAELSPVAVIAARSDVMPLLIPWPDMAVVLATYPELQAWCSRAGWAEWDNHEYRSGPPSWSGRATLLPVDYSEVEEAGKTRETRASVPPRCVNRRGVLVARREEFTLGLDCELMPGVEAADSDFAVSLDTLVMVAADASPGVPSGHSDRVTPVRRSRPGAGGGGTGKHVLEVLQRRVEKWVERNGFPWPQKLLAIYFRCAESSMSTVINASDNLKKIRGDVRELRGKGGKKLPSLEGAFRDEQSVDPVERAMLRDEYAAVVQWPKEQMLNELVRHVEAGKLRDALKMLKGMPEEELATILAKQRVVSNGS